MQNSEEITFGVPRFLSFIDLGYLLEAAKAADRHLASKLPTTSTEEGRNEAGNINATRQSLLRAVFISSFGIIEQNLDELMEMERDKLEISIAPSDLKHRGVKRSLTYAVKVLDYDVDPEASHWKDLFLVQDLRNHLVHYGPNFRNGKEHEDRFRKFSKSEYMTLRPIICFTVSQLENVFDLYIRCIGDFTKPLNE